MNKVQIYLISYVLCIILSGCAPASPSIYLNSPNSSATKRKEQTNNFEQNISGDEESWESIFYKAINGDVESQRVICVETYNNKKYDLAVGWCRKAAEKDNPDGQMALAQLYIKGNGVNQSSESAIYWMSKAADQDILEAQYTLAKFYTYEQFNILDYEKGAKLFQKLADLETSLDDEIKETISWAQYNLAEMYNNGKGVEKDDKEAVKYYEMSAENGNIYSMEQLESCYWGGCLGLTKDKDQEIKYLRMRAEHGVADAQNLLGMKYEYGFNHEYANASKHAPQEDLKKAFKLYEKAAQQGHKSAQSKLGRMYLDGIGPYKNYIIAVEWLKKAAEQGDKLGQFLLGICYADGTGISQDYVLSYMWLNLAAAKGSGDHYIQMRDQVAALMTPNQIAESQKLSREWQPIKQ